MSDHENQNDSGTPEAPKDSRQINIQVKDSNSEVFFKIKKTTKFEKVMKAFCERNGKDMSTTRFTFDGEKISKDATPAELNMEDGDLIDVFEQQIGGL